MATTTPTVPQTKVLKQMEVKGLTVKKLEDELKRPLGSPINGKEVGATFPVTLTGKIEIREFNGVKGAYHLTKEGYSIKVNASFDQDTHKAGAILTAVCRVFNSQDRGELKFCAFADN